MQRVFMFPFVCIPVEGIVTKIVEIWMQAWNFVDILKIANWPIKISSGFKMAAKMAA